MHPPTVDQYASYQLAKLRIENSGLIQGFLTKCAEAAYSPTQTLDALYDAARVSPHIAAEFAACGLQKRAFGSPGMAYGGGPLIPKPPTPPTPPKVPATFNTGGDSPSQHPGDAAISGAGQGVLNIGRGLWGGAKAVGGNVLAGLSAPAKPLARASDWLGITQHATPAVEGFQDSLIGDADAGSRDFMKTFSPTESALPGSHNAARVQQHQREMRSRGQNLSAGITGVADGVGRSALTTAAGGALTGIGNGAITLGGVASNGVQLAYNGAAGWAGGPDQVPATQEPPALAQQAPAAAQPSATPATPPVTTAPSAPPQPPAAQPPMGPATPPPPPPASQPPMGPATPPPPPAAVSTQPQAAPGAQPPEKPPSIIEQDPGFEAVAGLVKQDPVQATALGEKAIKQVSGAVTTAAGATELDALKKSGTLTPQGQQQATDALVSEGRYDWGQAAETVKNMDGWEQLGLWGGIGMAGLGLLHVLGGEGGVGSLLMSALGLGAAGFTAGQAGLFGQQGKDITAGLTDAVGSMFDPQSPEAAPAGAAPPEVSATGAAPPVTAQPGTAVDIVSLMKNPAVEIPKAVAAMPEQPNPTTANMLRQLADADPAKAKQMDDAAWWGPIGERRVASELKIPPHDAAKLMRHWKDFRAANPPAN